MAKEKKALADFLRDHINSKLDANFDYSKKKNRSSDLEEFVNSHKESKLIKSKVRPSYYQALEQCMKNRGLDVRALGLKTKMPKFYGSDLQAQITPEPQAGEASPKEKPPEVPAKGAPIKGAPAPVPPAQVYQNFDEKGVSASFNALFLMFRLLYPDLELLTEDEKESLGRMWLPAFNRYLTEKWVIIGIPTIATIGIFLPKLVEARRRKKEKEAKEEAQKKLQKEEPKEKKQIEPEEVVRRIEPQQKTPVPSNVKDYLKK